MKSLRRVLFASCIDDKGQETKRVIEHERGQFCYLEDVESLFAEGKTRFSEQTALHEVGTRQLLNEVRQELAQCQARVSESKKRESALYQRLSELEGERNLYSKLCAKLTKKLAGKSSRVNDKSSAWVPEVAQL